MTISNETMAILGKLVELGQTTAASKLASGLSDQENTSTKEAQPKEASKRTKRKLSPQESKQIKQELRRPPRRKFRDNRGKPLGLNVGSPVTYAGKPYRLYDVNLDSSAPRGVTLALVSTDFRTLIDYVYMDDLDTDEPSVDDETMQHWATTTDRVDSTDEMAQMIRDGKVDDVIKALTTEKVSAFENAWEETINRAGLASYKYLKQTLKGLQSIKWRLGFDGDSATAFYDVRFKGGRSVTLTLGITDHAYGDLYISTGNMDDDYEDGFTKEVSNEDHAEQILKNLRKIWHWAGDGRNLKEDYR